jgi:hypothetical protein
LRRRRFDRHQNRLNCSEAIGQDFREAGGRYAPTAGRLAAAIATNCAMPRLMRSCAERSNELTRCIEEILSRRRKRPSQDHGAKGKNGPPKGTCRGGGENSKIAIALARPGSGFIAGMQAVTDKFFSSQDESLTAATRAQIRRCARSA